VGRTKRRRTQPPQNGSPAVDPLGLEQKMSVTVSCRPNLFRRHVTKIAGVVCVTLFASLTTLAFSDRYRPELLDLIHPNRDVIRGHVEHNVFSPSSSASVQPGGSPGPRPSSATPSSIGTAAAMSGDALFREGGAWVFPHPIREADLQALNGIKGNSGDISRLTLARLSKWACESGGADDYQTRLRLELQGVDQPVDVTGIRAEVVSREAPYIGGRAYIGAGGSGDSVRIQLNLDQDRPASDYFVSAKLTLNPGEMESIDISPVSSRSAVTWRLVVDYWYDGRTRSTTFSTTGGGYFRTSGLPAKLAAAMNTNPTASVDEKDFYESVAVLDDNGRFVLKH
jgi:hypothetical protein